MREEGGLLIEGNRGTKPRGSSSRERRGRDDSSGGIGAPLDCKIM